MTEQARKAGWQAFDSVNQGDVPPWAGPVAPPRPERIAEPTVPGPSRAATGRRRRSRRRVLAAAAVVALAGLIGVGWYYLYGQPSRQSGPPLVQSFLPGEYVKVPNACRVLSPAALAGYLGGTAKPVLSFAYPDRSQCSFTVDARPVFRVLSLTLWAYRPYLGAPGDGSATDYAIYDFGRKRALFGTKQPPWPAATISPLSGLGTRAFSALQVLRGSTATDQVTVLVRYRNVLITVSLQAQESGGFGPVPAGVLQASAASAARQALGVLRSERVG